MRPMRRRWLWLLVPVFLGLALWLAIPQLQAWHHWAAAQTAMDRYHSAEALDHLNHFLKIRPDSVPAHLMACRASRRLGNFAEAQEHLEACQDLEDPLSAECDLEGQLLSAAAGHLESVESFLETWMGRHPTEAPLAWEALAEGYLCVYRIPDALRCLALWLERQPDNPQALFLRAKVAWQLGSHKRALPDYKRVVELDPDRADARRRLALCLLETGQFTEALTHLEVLRRRQPDDPELLASLARCQGKLGHFKAAHQTLENLMDRLPDYGLALRTRGQLALWEHQPAEAVTWLRRAVKALPHDYEAQFALTQALQQQGLAAEALAQTQITETLKKRLERMDEIKRKVMPERPHDPAVHCELGQLLLDLGHADVGRDWLLSALQLDPDYRPAHAALAEYYSSRGNAVRAAEHRQKAQPAK
jgi:predicted Zn-dependent protease